ncbi:hypothetical protein MC885_015897 [Smutsia gigantea]|nr:hypothetical protein MC885_015897 [Smutsia gigantea]
MGRVLGGAGSRPGIPVSAAVFSGIRASSARSGPLRLPGVIPERLRPPGWERIFAPSQSLCHP